MADPGLLRYVPCYSCNMNHRVSEEGETLRNAEVGGEQVAEDGLC